MQRCQAASSLGPSLLCADSAPGVVGYTSRHDSHSFALIQRFPIPVTIVAVLYTRTCIKLWRVDTVAHGNSRSERSAVQQRQVKELAKRKRAVKMMILAVTLFFLCYAPSDMLYWVNFVRLDF